jgi:microsomal epoxide hydrolase
MPAWIWEHQIRHFSQDHRVIAFDPRGQGSSDKPAFGYDHARRARDIDELIAHLDPAPVVLVGWSLGVLEVMKCLEEHGTGAIRAAVLVDWAMHYDNPAVFAGRYVSLQTEREQWTRSFIRATYRSEQSDAYLEKVTQAALDTPTNAAAIMIGNIILQGETDLRPLMNTFDRPALFVYSSNDWSIAAAEEVREGWPHFQVEVIDETSHTLFVDKPDEFNRVLEEFLATLPASK